jgi:hypothetical protein
MGVTKLGVTCRLLGPSFKDQVQEMTPGASQGGPDQSRQVATTPGAVEAASSGSQEGPRFKDQNQEATPSTGASLRGPDQWRQAATTPPGTVAASSGSQGWPRFGGQAQEATNRSGGAVALFA